MATLPQTSPIPTPPTDVGWLAVDADGHLALFDTGDDGLLPLAPLRRGADAPATPQPGACVAQLAALAEATGRTVDLDGDADTDRIGALGLFHYASAPGFRPYQRKAIPGTPVRVDDLPAGIRDKLVWMPLPQEHFLTAERVQPAAYAEQVVTGSAPDAGYLTADEQVRRALPGHEEAFRQVHSTDQTELPADEADERSKAFYQRLTDQSRSAARWGYALAAAMAVGALVAWALLAT